MKQQRPLAYAHFRQRLLATLLAIALLASMAVWWKVHASHEANSGGLALAASNAWNGMIKRDLIAGGLGLATMALIMLIGGRFMLRSYAALEDSEKRYRGLYADMRRDKASLSTSERQLRMIADNLPVVIGYVDRAQRVAFASRKSEAVYGVPYRRVTGMSVSDLLSPAAYAQSQPYIDAALSGKAAHFERKVQGPGGERWEAVSYVPDLQRDGTSAGFFLMVDDITERKAAQALVWRQANYDQLTGLPNRGMFMERLRHELAAGARWPHGLAVLFIDLDGFKMVNDTWGHASGDGLLKEAARRMQGCVRTSDMVARLAGDEFTVLISGIQRREDVDHIARELTHSLSAPFALHGHPGSAFVSASIGISCAPNDGNDADELVRNADQAMYAAKREGRGGFVHYARCLTA